MYERCQAVSYDHYPCLGQARYLVRAERPGETERPTCCFTHAKRMVRTGLGPQGVIYKHAPDGHGWVVMRRTSSGTSHGHRADRDASAALVRDHREAEHQTGAWAAPHGPPGASDQVGVPQGGT
jgi:hypothetical protein